MALLSLFPWPVAPPTTPIVDGTYAWSYVNVVTGQHTGSPKQDSFTSTIESMVKPWIAADYLRRTGNPPPWRLAELSTMLRDSDDLAAEDVYRADGTDAVIQRMISICGLQHTRVESYWWSLSTTSASDTVRLGLCLADGRAAGPWTWWLLSEMRQVRGGLTEQHATSGGGRWGLVDGLPPYTASWTAIKNGWTVHDGLWHVDCLAVHPEFVIGVVMQYPAAKGLAYGAAVCATIARQLINSAPPLRYL